MSFLLAFGIAKDGQNEKQMSNERLVETEELDAFETGAALRLKIFYRRRTWPMRLTVLWLDGRCNWAPMGPPDLELVPLYLIAQI